MNNVRLHSTTRVTSCERVDRRFLVLINGENMGSVRKEIDLGRIRRLVTTTTWEETETAREGKGTRNGGDREN